MDGSSWCQSTLSVKELSEDLTVELNATWDIADYEHAFANGATLHSHPFPAPKNSYFDGFHWKIAIRPDGMFSDEKAHVAAFVELHCRNTLKFAERMRHVGRGGNSGQCLTRTRMQKSNISCSRRRPRPSLSRPRRSVPLLHRTKPSTFSDWKGTIKTVDFATSGDDAGANGSLLCPGSRSQPPSRSASILRRHRIPLG
ncbi:hypothetical protein RvY_12506-1 [Ramazzottius varieornatus]|uniref:MATH domain-containing protein n=1 Tax=Ramazzottius varieornatus TaxID=947166 RepID=A0A1D1VSC8_RAMVA|nr:hypothetical protein RvY_12506-1 [Ramazzottius varieornatus]